MNDIYPYSHDDYCVYKYGVVIQTYGTAIKNIIVSISGARVVVHFKNGQVGGFYVDSLSLLRLRRTPGGF